MKTFLYHPIGPDFRLLPQSLAHYRDLGVDEILLDVNLTNDNTLDKQVTKTIHQYRATIVDLYTGDYVHHAQRRENAIKRYCGNDDWVVMADCDEFHEYPMPLSVLAKDCDRRQTDYVTGELVDRVTKTGALPQLNGDALWDQFPVGADITKLVLNGRVTKVVMTRPSVKVPRGQHEAFGGIGYPEEGLYIPVHHFKWDSTVKERTERYIGVLKRTTKDPYEKERLLRYLEQNDGRFNLSDPDFSIQWPEYGRSIKNDYDPSLHPTHLDPKSFDDMVPIQSTTVKVHKREQSHVVEIRGDKIEMDDAAWCIWGYCRGGFTIAQIAIRCKDRYFDITYTKVVDHIKEWGRMGAIKLAKYPGKTVYGD